MNQYVKEFLHRGLIFGGFGPIILGIVYAILDKTVANFSLSGMEVLVAVCSIYLLAFVQAGASVFHQMERLSMPTALLCHLSVLYFAYILCYLVNRWIPFEPAVILIFTVVFVVSYFLVWGIVVISIKVTTKKLNRKLGKF
jgi:hypothetical protein